MADRETKEGKTEYLKNEKSFLNEIKSIFHNKGYHLVKTSGHKL